MLFLSFSSNYCMEQIQENLTSLRQFEKENEFFVVNTEEDMDITTVLYHNTHSNELIACAAYYRSSDNTPPPYEQVLKGKQCLSRAKKHHPNARHVKITDNHVLVFCTINANIFIASLKQLVNMEKRCTERQHNSKLSTATDIKKSIQKLKSNLRINGQLDNIEMQKLEKKLIELDSKRSVKK